mgnify:CR=1 FL=1
MIRLNKKVYRSRNIFAYTITGKLYQYLSVILAVPAPLLLVFCSCSWRSNSPVPDLNMDVDAVAETATSIPTATGQCVNLALLILLNNFSALKTESFIYNTLS